MLSLLHCTFVLLFASCSFSLPLAANLQKRDVPDFVRRYGIWGPASYSVGQQND